MNRLPLATALLSAALAVALWFIASWLQPAPHWPSPVGQTDTLEPDETPTVAHTVGAGGGLSCLAVENELRATVNRSKSCVTDTDCAILDYGYPIECLTSVARSQISSLRKEYQRYHRSCEFRVYFDCPTGEMTRRAVCRSNQCTVELVTPDSLADDTLKHLERRQ